MPTVTVFGREVDYLRRGTGAPLLLIQGMAGTIAAWGEPFLSALARDFECIAYSHRGVGGSSRVEEPFSIVDLAEDAAGLFAALGIGSAHVLGISLGGMVAQELALRHDGRVRTLTLGATYAGGPGSSLIPPDVAQRLYESKLTGDREHALRTSWELNLSTGFRADESRYQAFREMALDRPVATAVIMLQAQASLGHDASSRLPSMVVPTLVIHGTDDEVFDVSNGQIIAGLIPAARLELLEGAGHMFWWEQPERSASLVREHALGSTADVSSHGS